MFTDATHCSVPVRKQKKRDKSCLFHHITSKTPRIHSLHFSPHDANFNKKGKTAEDNTKEPKCPGFILWRWYVQSCDAKEKFCKVGLKSHSRHWPWRIMQLCRALFEWKVSLYTKIMKLFFLENYFHCCIQYSHTGLKLRATPPWRASCSFHPPDRPLWIAVQTEQTLCVQHQHLISEQLMSL